jgi:y4mF family transcriptional regulator
MPTGKGFAERLKLLKEFSCPFSLYHEFAEYSWFSVMRWFCYIGTLKGVIMNNSLSLFVKEMRKRFGLTQVDLAAKAGVGLRFVRELEQGKQTLRIDKVNQVLALFGYEVGAVPAGKEHSV